MKQEDKNVIELIDNTFNDFKIFLLDLLNSNIKELKEKQFELYIG